MDCTAKLSVIVPVYNVAPYLRKCLDSLLGQSYSNLEIILCDDGSTDNSGAICDEYAQKDSRCLVIHKENEGVCTARNAAFQKVTGDYVTFVDSDDFLEPNAYETVLSAVQEHAADACFYGWKRIHADTGQTQYTFKGRTGIGTGEEALRQALLFNGYAGHIWNKVFSTAYWKQDGVIRLPEMDPAFAVGEDCEWLVRMLRPYRNVVVLSDCLYNYLVRSDSAVNIRQFTEARLTEIPAREKIAQEAAAVWPALEDPARAKAYARLIQNGKLAFQLRDRHAAARIKPHLSKNRRSYFRCGEISLTQKLKAIAAEVLIRFT